MENKEKKICVVKIGDDVITKYYLRDGENIEESQFVLMLNNNFINAFYSNDLAIKNGKYTNKGTLGQSRDRYQTYNSKEEAREEIDSFLADVENDERYQNPEIKHIKSLLLQDIEKITIQQIKKYIENK